MQEAATTGSTTIRVSRSLHRMIRELASRDGVTMEVELRRLVRLDRQLRMADAVRSEYLDADDLAVVAYASAVVGRESSRQA